MVTESDEVLAVKPRLTTDHWARISMHLLKQDIIQSTYGFFIGVPTPVVAS